MPAMLPHTDHVAPSDRREPGRWRSVSNIVGSGRTLGRKTAFRLRIVSPAGRSRPRKIALPDPVELSSAACAKDPGEPAYRRFGNAPDNTRDSRARVIPHKTTGVPACSRIRAFTSTAPAPPQAEIESLRAGGPVVPNLRSRAPRPPIPWCNPPKSPTETPFAGLVNTPARHPAYLPTTLSPASSGLLARSSISSTKPFKGDASRSTRSAAVCRIFEEERFGHRLFPVNQAAASSRQGAAET